MELSYEMEWWEEAVEKAWHAYNAKLVERLATEALRRREGAAKRAYLGKR